MLVVNVRENKMAIKAVRKAVEEGAVSLERIAEKSGFSYGYASQLISKDANNPDLKERRLRAIKNALNEGVNSLEELCRRAELRTGEGVIECCRRNNIKLPDDLIPYKQRPEIDVLIGKGQSLSEIGKEVDLSRQMIKHYIIGSGQYKLWSEKRKNVARSGKFSKFRKEAEGDLKGKFLSCVRERTKELAKEEGWAIEKAVQYLTIGRNPLKIKYSFSNLVQLFQIYEDAFKNGEMVKLSDLGKGIFSGAFDSVASRVSYIFKNVGIEPMYRKAKMKVKKRGEKKEAVQRGFGLEFSGPDIAYFLELPKHVPSLRYSRIGKRPNAKRFIKSFHFSGTLTYKLASQIYEARENCGFNVEEICGLLDIDKRLINHTLKNKDEIEPRIIAGLRTLYADSSIKTPYVTKEMKERLERLER